MIGKDFVADETEPVLAEVPVVGTIIDIFDQVTILVRMLCQERPEPGDVIDQLEPCEKKVAAVLLGAVGRIEAVL